MIFLLSTIEISFIFNLRNYEEKTILVLKDLHKLLLFIYFFFFRSPSPHKFRFDINHPQEDSIFKLHERGSFLQNLG